MTDNLLLLVMLAGIMLPIVLFFLERRRKIEYVVFGVGVLMILATLAILILEQRSEPPQTALSTDQQPDAAALLPPSTATETRDPVTSSATPEEAAASGTISAPVAAETVATTLDTPAPRPTEDETPSAAPEAVVSTVRVRAANVRREPAGTSHIIGTVARDDELVVIDTLNGWYLVRLGERHAPQSMLKGGQGWIWGELINIP